MAAGTASATYGWTGTATGLHARLATAAATYGWSGAAVGSSPKTGMASGRYNWSGIRPVGDNGIILLPDDRWRVIVQETRSGEITARDVTVSNLVVQRALSAGCDISFDVDFHDSSVAGIYFKPWEQYIHLEKVMLGKRKIFATGIVQPSDVDPKSGVLHLKAKGFAAYPKGIPWLEDLNWLANDAYEPVVEIWRHLQEDFPNGDLNVEIFPTTSGVEMLPGYAFDGDLLNLNFFATFVRATDKLDCGDYIDALARDIPFDYKEISEWTSTDSTSDNLLVNPPSDLTGWHSGGDYQATYDGTVGHTANGSVKFAATGNQYSFIEADVVDNHIPVKPGDKIDMSAWIRYATTAPVAGFGYTYRAADGHGLGFEYLFQAAAPSTSFAQVTGVTKTIPDGTAYITAFFDSQGDGTLWFDDVELTITRAYERTDITKKIQLGYPRLGLIQETTAFVINENVLSAKPHTETETEWVSDVGVSGWFPGFEYSFELANADPNRLRRYLAEEDAFIDSNERSAAWAHRRLARRQTPPYWEQITIDPNHPNAPAGTFDVGDTITVSGFMPWVGNIKQEHKIIAISVDTTKNTWTLQLMAEGAFNYDPIFYPDGITNIIDNPGFNYNLSGWNATGPGWTWDGSQGAKALGSVTITADSADHDLLTQPFGVSHFQIFPMSVSVKCTGAVSSGDGIQLVAQFYDDALNPTTAIQVAALAPSGVVPWQKLGGGSVLTPVGSTHVALRLHISSSMTAGRVWFDDAVLTL
jgi:hypothetical protein